MYIFGAGMDFHSHWASMSPGPSYDRAGLHVFSLVGINPNGVLKCLGSFGSRLLYI